MNKSSVHSRSRNIESVDDQMKRVKVIDQDANVIVVYKPKRKSKKGNKSQKIKRASVSSSRSLDRDRETPSTTDKSDSNEKTKDLRVSKSRSSRKSKSKRKGSSHDLEDSSSLKDFTDMGKPKRRTENKDIVGQLEEASDDDSLRMFDVEQPTSPRRSLSKSLYQMEQRNSDSSEKSRMPAVSAYDRLNYRIRSTIKDLMRFRALKIAQVLLAIYVCFMTFFGGLRDPETGLIIDQDSAERTAKGLILVNGTERAIVGASTFQVACIVISRLSAWFMYPALVFVFISKFRATATFLSKSPLAMYMYSDPHELHVYCGWTIFLCSLVHTIFHVARWAEQGNLDLLINHFSGITGVIIITSCLLICIPMTFFRERLKYEMRKNMHYLFIAFAGALVFHTPTSAIPNGGFTAFVFGTLISWYLLDASYCYFFMTEKIDTTNFAVLPSGVRMTMNVSERFQKLGTQGGVCYVCLPWVAKDQWHAFSLFENPSNPAERQIFIMKTGDWTTKLHRHLQRDTVRPAWVHGPFPSPYDNAESYDNQILVASGIGITPALSCIRAHKESRRINLIWAVRDRHLLEFFLRHLYLDHEGWNLIFYTGKDRLKGSTIDILTNTNICIIEGRPKLSEVIPNIIYGVESGLGLPERYSPGTRAIASEMLADRLADSHNDEMAEDLACYASELGFHLPMETISQEFSLFASQDLSPGRRHASESIMGHLALGFRPWDYQEGARKYVKNLDRKLVIPTWGMLYCGGAKPVLSELEKISDEYQIGLHVESFAW